MSEGKSIDWINRLGKWRTVFTGWQLGTRAKGDPESDAIRDHREATMMLRAEASAVSQLLLRKGVFTAEEYTEQVTEECRLLCKLYERKFPGFKAEDYGIHVDTAIARDTTAGWKP
ncbi:MAG TPA: hypothetical protein VGG49_02355 [Steroidobacteraceae bacterium]|jgi:hypothetical protein